MRNDNIRVPTRIYWHVGDGHIGGVGDVFKVKLNISLPFWATGFMAFLFVSEFMFYSDKIMWCLTLGMKIFMMWYILAFMKVSHKE